jgi:hypothetical protein
MTWGLALRSAAVTIVAVAVTLGIALLLDPEPGAAVFGMLLAITLSRSQLERDLRGRLEAGIALPLVSLAGLGVGVLLVTVPPLGAAVFAVGVAASVYLRRFGPLWRRIGGLIALPFTALLVAPVHSERLGPVLSAVGALVLGLVAWAAVTLLQLAAIRLRILPRPRPVPAGERTPPRPGGMQPDATTRLALQMLVTVGLAFVVGFLAFPDRWSWVVVTALTVTLGNVGRADVADKAVQRVIGAGAGSLVALGALLVPDLQLGAGIAIVLLVLFAGLVLRPFGYVWWALAITVVLALAQSLTAGPFTLGERWEEIVVGGVLAVAVAGLLLPVPSEAVVRRRIAEALGALSDWLAIVAPGRDAPDPAAPGAEAAAHRVHAALDGLDRAGRPFDDMRRWLPRRLRPRAVGWLAATRAGTAESLAAPRAAARRPLGEARKALREPGALQSALDDFVAATR